MAKTFITSKSWLRSVCKIVSHHQKKAKPMDRTNISKSFKVNFVIDKSKAVRINDIIESHFKKLNEEGLNTKIEILLNNEKELSLNKFSNIFQLDNGRKNKIRKIKSTYSLGNNEAEVIFSDYPKISIDVVGEDLDWTNEVFAEIEEQVERTKVFSIIGKYKNNLPFWSVFPIFLITGIAISSILGLLLIEENVNKVDKQELKEIALEANSTEEKINFLFDAHLKELNIDLSEPNGNTNSINFTKYLADWRTYMIILPILAIIGIIWYLLANCYPPCVFNWGDMQEDYQKVLERRKLLWNIVIGSIIIGILTNFFVFSITSFDLGK